MNERQFKALEELLSKTRNPHEIADQLDLKLSEVRDVMRTIELDELPGWGRQSMQRYIVSRRTCGAAAWPASDQTRLLECRRQHDQGRVTMCQGRDGEFIIQYAVPTRGRPLKRNAYFSGV